MEKKKESSKTENASASVQTEDQPLLRCNECEYPAEDIYDLGEHMFEFHSEQASESCDSEIICHFCGDNFKMKEDLMIHRKNAHKEKVNYCRYFSSGNCVFGDDACWYSHSRSDTDKSVTEFKCSICEKEFKVRSDFMHHRKQKLYRFCKWNMSVWIRKLKSLAQTQSPKSKTKGGALGQSI